MKNQEALIMKQREDKYRTLIDQASDPILIYSFDGTIHEFNNSCCNISGYSREEYAKLNLSDILLGDIIINRENFTAIMDEQAITLNRQFKRKDGVLLDMEIKVKMIEDGKVIAFGRDITERKKAEKAMKESEAFNRSILASITSAIAVVDKEGNILSVNKAWNDFSIENGESVLNHTGIGTNYITICEQAEESGDITAAVALKGFIDVINKEKPFFEMEYPCHSATEQRWFLLRISDFAGDSPKVVMMHIDISRRKEAEARMQEAFERYDILSRATSDTIWDWDIVNNKMLYNEGITKIFGYSFSSIENVVEWWKMKIHPDDLERISGSIDDVFKNRLEHIQLEYRFRCEDGSYKYVFDRGFIIFDENAKPIRMIGAMQDITHKNEEENRIAKAIIDAQEQERHFIGVELHDNVNQILVGALLSLGMVKEKQLFTEKESDYIEKTKGYIINAIDEIRKLSHQLVPVAFENISLKEIFENQLLKINVDNRFTINLLFDDINKADIPDDIQINLYRILQEQIKNIIKHAEATIIEIGVTILKDTVTMRIADNGRGFNTKTEKKGIGLGNIKKRAESLGGKFILNSDLGKGCEVMVVIPLNKAE